MSATRIVVIAKAPQPGQVKTRLIPALGADGAAALAAHAGVTLVAAFEAAGTLPPDPALGVVELCASRPETRPGRASWSR